MASPPHASERRPLDLRTSRACFLFLAVAYAMHTARDRKRMHALFFESQSDGCFLFLAVAYAMHTARDRKRMHALLFESHSDGCGA